MDALLFGGVHASFYSLSLLRHDLTLSVSEPDNAAAQTGAGTSFGANGDQHTRAVELSTYFCVLTIRKQLPGNGFERSGRGQEPSRGHKFSILENVVLHWGFHCSTSLRKRGPTPNPAKIVYGKLEVVCYKISATNSSIKRFTCSGLSVLELCPAPSIHVKGIFVLRCHALLYRIHEPA